MKQKVKLLISDEGIVNAACTSAQSFIDIDVAALRRAIETAGVESIDDSSLDATDAAHPAWWRGQEAASKVWAARVEKLETELKKQASKAETYKRDWYQAKSEFGDAAAKLRGELRDAQGEVSRLVALLASGQCVDLAKLSDDALIGSIMGDLVNFVPQSVIDESAAESRQWLISKAGVKL